MHFFEFVITIVSLSFAFSLLMQYLRHRRGRTGDAEASAVGREMADLRARVEALEAIVTDRPRQLAQEIDALERAGGR